MSKLHKGPRGFSLTELMSVIMILGLLAGLIVPRVTGEHQDSKISACHAHCGNIDIQAELWFTERGRWPTGTLQDIGSDSNYFPSGLPTCPVDSTKYSLNPRTGRVIGHTH